MQQGAILTNDYWLLFMELVQELDAVVRLVGFRVDDVPGDGNCMYESVSRQLTALGQSCTWQDVKQQLLGHIRQSSTDNASVSFATHS